MIGRPFDKIDRSDLDALVAGAVSERRDLDFKRDLPGNASDDINEFLADATSLANAQGGDLIFGMNAKDGVATDLVGLAVQSRDKTLQRLESFLRDSVDPRLNGVRMKWISIDNSRYALIIRVPPSLAAPHRVSRRTSGFYGRNSAGKHPMDTQELRVAFIEAEQLPRKIRALHVAAVAGARGKDLPVVLDEPAAVVSTVPLAFFREARDLPLSFQNLMRPVGSIGSIDYINTLEGLLVHTPVDATGHVRSYTLTHWSGRVDAAWTIGRVFSALGEEKRCVYPSLFEPNLIDAAGTAVVRLREYGIEGPWVVQATIVGARGFQLTVNSFYASRPGWRDVGRLGSLVIDQANEESLTPHLKAFWRLFGLQRPERS